MATGKTNREIGLELGIEGETVMNTLRRAYKKLSVDNRVSAAIRFLQVREIMLKMNSDILEIPREP